MLRGSQRTESSLFAALPPRPMGRGRGPAQPEPTQVGKVSQRGTIPKPVGFAAIGFVAGALFWHCVGFWSVMSQILFSSPETVRPAPTALQQAAPIETGSLQRLEKLTAAKVEPACTSVMRDAAVGAVRQIECRKLARPLRTKPARERQDRKLSQPPEPLVSQKLNTDLPLSPSWTAQQVRQ